jgi:glutaredoxin 3
MAMRYLDDQKIKYTYIDVDEKPEYAEEAVSKSGQRGIPIIDIDGKIIIGFDRPEIDKAIKSNQPA